MECHFGIDETEYSLQSMNLNPDNVDGRPYERDIKKSIEETSQYPTGSCDVVDKGVPQYTRQVPQYTRHVNTQLSELPLKVYSRVCMILNVRRDLKFDDFRMLAEKVGFDRDFIRNIEQITNPTDVILQQWSSKNDATVGNLIELLKGEDLQRMDVVKILEDWVNESSD